MNEREIYQSSSGNVSFLGTKNLHGGPSVGDVAATGTDGASDEYRVLTDLHGRGSVHREVDGSRSYRDAEMEEAALSDAGHGDAIPSSSHVVVRFPVADHREFRDFDEDSASYQVALSDGIRVPHGLVQNLMEGFKIGDMVWGKVKSHPWWPGHIFNEAFVLPEVRRAKREGHFLVAFFGDSSYGWFHPMELVPFAPHFAEKSKQTTMKNFVRAVDEAVDETSRREALGLTCYCRNKSNFRPAPVPDHFHVDVPGFEPGGVYSSKQIDDARDRFMPQDVLSFVQQAALDPMPSQFPDLDRIRSMATLLAYRRAVFEEFDETYAQAFGVEPVRPSPNSRGIPDQPERFAPRAIPLSGKLVVPESARHRKVSAAKLTATKVPKKVPSAKKNKYLLKRRDETPGDDPAGNAGSPQHSLPDLLSSSHSYLNINSNQQQNVQYVPTGGAFPLSSKLDQYVLQKRPLPLPGAEEEQQQAVWDDSKAEVPRTTPQQFELGAVGGAAARTPTPEDAKQLKVEPWTLDPKSGAGGTRAAEAVADSKDGVRMEAVQPLIADGKVALPRAAAVGTVKKEKIRKRRLEDVVGFVGGPEQTGEMKKKKKKKASSVDSGVAADHLSLNGAAMVADKSAGKSILMASENQRIADSALKPDEVDLNTKNVDLRLVVSDIQELAVNHSYAAERHADAIALEIACKYRSLVYLKGLVLPPPGEPDAPELRPAPSKELAAARTMQESDANRFGAAVLARKKAITKSDDPMKAGRKRSPSERQEEVNAKRARKLDKLKSLPGEKKASIGLKAAAAVAAAAKGLQRNQKDKELSPATATTLKGKLAISKGVEGAAAKQQQQPPPPPLLPKTPSPTVLVMKFPARSTLPSVTSLKARFARFGPLDHSAIRVFWKSYTCKVVFKFKPDAEAALNYVNSNDLFGQIKVTYYLREVDAPGSDPPASSELGKQLMESRPAVEVLQGGGAVSFGTSKPLLSRPPDGQLKSILKKSGEDAGTTRETSRGVRFMLGGEDETKAAAAKTSGSVTGDGAPSSYTPSLEPPLLSRNPKSFGLFPPRPPPLTAAPTRPTSSNPVAMLHNQRLPPPSLLGPPPSVSLPPRPRPLPLQQPQLHVPDVQLPLPPPPRTAEAPQLRLRYGEHGSSVAAESRRHAAAPDISEQLMGLLIRCRDVVNNVRDAFGYLPYHPI